MPAPRRSQDLAKIGMALALGILILAISVQTGWLPGVSDFLQRGAATSVRIRDIPASPTPPPVVNAPSKAVNNDQVFDVVEHMPEMIGGQEALQTRIRYPAIAKEAGIQGRVVIRFIVDKKGNVTDPVVARGIGAGCDEEAVRALGEMKFVPGRQRGHSVRVKMTLPIAYRLN